MTPVAQAVRQAAARLAAAGCETPQLDAEVLLADLLRIDRLHLYLDSKRRLTSAEEAAYEERCRAREQREPVALILGHKEFYGRPFRVRPGVLVPRPDTEAVVVEALDCLDQFERASSPPAAVGVRRLLDAGSGSGVIGITLLLERPDWTGVAVDRSPVAVALTAENAERLGVGARLQVVAADWSTGGLTTSSPLSGPFSLIVSNPPYVPAAAWERLAPEICRWEPRDAVAAGEAGLDAYGQLLPQAFRLLQPGGFCVVEIGEEGQVAAVGELAQRSGFIRQHLGYDGAGRPRALSWQRPA